MFRKNSGFEKFKAEEGGSFTVWSKNFLSHRTEKTSPGNYSVFQKISGREQIFMDKKGGRYHDFPSKSFYLTVPKYFIGEHFGVSGRIFHRKFSCIGGGGATRFCRKILSHITETKSFVKEPFCFPEIFSYRKKIMDKRGLITFFRRKFSVSQCRTTSYRNPLVFH